MGTHLVSNGSWNLRSVHEGFHRAITAYRLRTSQFLPVLVQVGPWAAVAGCRFMIWVPSRTNWMACEYLIESEKQMISPGFTDMDRYGWSWQPLNPVNTSQYKEHAAATRWMLQLEESPPFFINRSWCFLLKQSRGLVQRSQPLCK